MLTLAANSGASAYAILYRFAAGDHYNMRTGVDIGGTKIEVAVLDPAGGTRFQRRVATPPGDYGATLAAVAALVGEADSAAGTKCSVGIGIPGAISPASGLVKNANSVWLNGKPLAEDLEMALGRAVRIANDANCFALSEATDGAAAGARSVFGVILGTGVGGGLVIAGQVVGGVNAIGGEWGHNPLPRPADDERPGPRCWCGRQGCVETFLSGSALSRSHESATGRKMDAAEIARAAAGGDTAAQASMGIYENRLARALAGVINIVDPDIVVLGGGLSNVERLYETVPAIWDRWIFSDRVDTKLAPPRHGDSSGVRGAAWLWPKEPAP
jgi:fructokinase